jgi:hypothetical protein
MLSDQQYQVQTSQLPRIKYPEVEMPGPGRSNKE